MTSPAELTIRDAVREIEAGKLSSVELVRETLAAIDRENEELNAYLYVDADAALAAARRADDAVRRGGAGPLTGVPICVKDVIGVAGMPTTAGASGWLRHPSGDAIAVARLRRAGAIVVGKGNTNEFAFGIDGQNPHWGSCRNPRDRTRMSGGSSSGPAVATAGLLASGGIGTDTSGSLRAPASLCGLVAIRPTHGLVPTDGVVPLAWSYDTVGPLVRSVADASLLLGVMAGRPGTLAEGAEHDRGAAVRGLRVGLATELIGVDCAREVAAATRGAAELLESLGAEVETVELPLLANMETIHQVIQFSEAAAVHAPWIDDQRGRYEPAVLDRLEAGAAMLAKDYLLAQRARQLLRIETADAMAGIDAWLAPATPVTAPPLGAETVTIDGRTAPLRPALLSFTLPLTQHGGPVVAVPLGESDGLPFGLQIAGRPGSEPLLLGLAASYRRAAGAAEA